MTTRTNAATSAARPNDDIDQPTRLSLYRSLLEVRLLEKRAYDLFLQNLVKGTSHLSLGQEAVASGFAVAMRPDDYTYCTYRGMPIRSRAAPRWWACSASCSAESAG